MKTLGIFCTVILAATVWGASEKTKSAPRGSSGKVVPYERLKELLPQMPEWTRGDPRGETDLKEAVSRVQVDYDKGESTLSFEFMDTMMNKVMLDEVLPLMKPGYLEKRPDGYTKATTVREFPAIEEWTNEVRTGFISVLVGGRFAVKVTGQYVANVETIRAAVEAVDLQKLAALK